MMESLPYRSKVSALFLQENPDCEKYYRLLPHHFLCMLERRALLVAYSETPIDDISKLAQSATQKIHCALVDGKIKRDNLGEKIAVEKEAKFIASLIEGINQPQAINAIEEFCTPHIVEISAANSPAPEMPVAPPPDPAVAPSLAIPEMPVRSAPPAKSYSNLPENQPTKPEHTKSTTRISPLPHMFGR